MSTRPGAAEELVGRSAGELAERVRAGTISPAEVVRAHLARILAVDGRVGAFQDVRRERALAEAEALARAPDLGSLPLAGVPIAIKDNLDVAGEPTRMGCRATPETPAAGDSEAVRRLRAAGAIVVGKTRLPELGIWATTDGAFGVTRSPWGLERTAGGSSGGSAAAVAAAMVPIALGNDGMGSIRIPAAACGLVGVKPGAGVVPTGIGAHDWFGMAENGPLTTTVADAAHVLSVLADRPDLAEVRAPTGPVRIALSTRSPAQGVRAERAWAEAARASAALLRQAGHAVEHADPRYPTAFVPAIFGHWFAGPLADAERLDPRRLEPRTRRHLAWGRLARRLGLVSARRREAWRGLHASFFEHHDVLLTPALARVPPPADHWSERSWLANVVACVRYAPFNAPWNFAGFPALVVPAGRHPSGMPLAVQLVAAPGGEALLLSLAAELERLQPWPRHAPEPA